MLQASQYDISKALASYAVEQSLVEVGPTVLNLISNKIFEKHQCYIPDCYEHPEYLNAVLGGMSSTMHNMIVQLIRNQLEEFSYQEKIQNFLEKLNHGLNMNSNIAMAQ